MHDLSRTIVLIPCYEPDEKLFRLLKELYETNFLKIVLVNDGSGESFSPIFKQCEESFGCTLISYQTNRGKGFALKTGFRYIIDKIQDFDCIVTADSDGQHTPEDIRRVAAESLANPEFLILGTRDYKNKNVPLRSKFGNSLTRIVFKFISGISINDTQTGLRGFSKKVVKNFIKTAGDRYDYEMRVLMQTKQKNIPIKQVKIETVYIDDNSSSHFNPFKDSIRIYSVFGAHIATFLFSSLFATLIDWLLFSVLIYFVFQMKMPENSGFSEIISSIPLFISFITARAVSSFINFIINRKIVFKNKKKAVLSAAKYYLLVIVIAVLTYLLLSLFIAAGIPSVIAQPLATVILFFASYYFQRAFVF
ncbi:MAG: hypothetical protein DBX47_01550 [Clostridiales bacterium]|nr:MAG: hypothetical protein DBX47_01550 [Clostridiales bacterium]